MFLKQDIPKLVAQLNSLKRPPNLFHACQLMDLESYLTLGGVPSRNLLIETGLPFTPFESDDKDRARGHDRFVFFNLSDSGLFFHTAKRPPRGTPNCYGPILISVAPEALLDADDVALCLLSISDDREGQIDRKVDSLGPSDDLTLLFEENGRVKFVEEIRSCFAQKKAGGAPELSCNFKDEKAPISQWRSIIVDPLHFDGRSLYDEVKKIVGERRIPINERTTKYAGLYGEFVSATAQGRQTFEALKEARCYQHVPDWLTKASQPWMYDRFSKYLSVGTLTHLSRLTAEAKVVKGS